MDPGRQETLEGRTPLIRGRTALLIRWCSATPALAAFPPIIGPRVRGGGGGTRSWRHQRWGGGGAPTSRRVSHSPRAPNPGPIFSLHRLWIIEPPPPAGGAGRPGEPGSGPSTAALQTPSPARHLPLPPPVASHPWPRSQAARARPLCNYPGGVWGGGGCARGCPRGPLLSPSFLQGDPPRSAGSTLQLRPHPTSLDVFNHGGRASVSLKVTSGCGGSFWRERQGQVRGHRIS